MSQALREERLLTILVGPHISEKSHMVAESGNQVVFKVRTDATKAEIKAAGEQLFEVSVEGVSVVNRTNGQPITFKAGVSMQGGQQYVHGNYAIAPNGGQTLVIQKPEGHKILGM